ncbi:hypothetical protein BD413DRAFT_479692 [Trametes elegans]|nr:hypothetical protein BD413DRAFT_479692 [Trametes elegans]
MTDHTPTAIVPSSLYRDPHNGDLVIYTSDEAKLYVFKALIAAATPSIFLDILSLPQPTPSPTHLTKPVVSGDESSAIWETLVMPCYAPRAPLPSNFDDLQAIRPLLNAGRKCNMDAAIEHAQLAFLLPKFVAAEPFRVYALGCAYALPDVALGVARQTLRLPIGLEYVEEFGLVPSRAYHRLSEYREECGLVARNVIGNPFISYLKALHTQFEFLPDAALACSPELLQAVKKPFLRCSHCVERIDDRMARFAEAVRSTVEDVISQVSGEPRIAPLEAAIDTEFGLA